MIPAQYMSLGCSCGLEPFDIGYAYEALPGATSLAGNPQKAAEYLSPAQTQAQLVKNAERRAPLLNDRGGLQAWCPARRCIRRTTGRRLSPAGELHSLSVSFGLLAEQPL